MNMAVEQVESVIGRLTRDKAFRLKYCQDPDATLEAYLSPEEIQAIKTGDGHTLSSMGCKKWDELLASLCMEVPSD
jgi:hypothetical protein